MGPMLWILLKVLSGKTQKMHKLTKWNLPLKSKSVCSHLILLTSVSHSFPVWRRLQQQVLWCVFVNLTLSFVSQMTLNSGGIEEAN